MLQTKHAIIIAFAIFIGIILLCPAEAKSQETNQPVMPEIAKLFDGGTIPETQQPKPQISWKKVKIAGQVRNISIDISSKPVVAGSKAIYYKGQAFAPYNAPNNVKLVIWAGNKINNLPYVWGGGHGSWSASGYDCSGSVSYALHGGKLLNTAMTSGDLASWGQSGQGKWITVYANSGHVYMYVAGLRFDTSGANPSRWQAEIKNNSAYVARHPAHL